MAIIGDAHIVLILNRGHDVDSLAILGHERHHLPVVADIKSVPDTGR